jgi:NAD(P)-dependent dehydrogenase (short-subunit alcohol dehydrogenase family)
MDDQPLPRGALSGKVAVVVGGASGIGRTAANALARQGARVVVADFDAARMERTVEEILRLGSSDAALALHTDVRNDNSARSLASDAIQAMGQVDILINMAGVLLKGPLDRIKPGDWKWMLDTNLLGPVRAALAFLPHMTERGSGHIINTVNADALTPHDPLSIAYDTGQVALASFTRSLESALKGTGVSVSLRHSAAIRAGQNTDGDWVACFTRPGHRRGGGRFRPARRRPDRRCTTRADPRRPQHPGAVGRSGGRRERPHPTSSPRSASAGAARSGAWRSSSR